MPLLFFIFFIIMNGKITLETVIFGVVISALMTLFAMRFLNYNMKAELRFYRFSGYYLAYAAIVIKEIFKANMAVIRLIYTPGRKPEPVLITFNTGLKSEYARVALANSITLTPGTITVGLEGDRYTVHCLDKEFVCDFNESVFTKYLEKIEEKTGVAGK